MGTEPVNVVGIIYSREIAQNTFGAILEKSGINSLDLSKIISSAGSYIMFYLLGGKLIITDEKRNPLHPLDAEVLVDTVFHYFSVTKVDELLKLGNASETEIELRKDVLSISNGNFTLENSKPCPPYCP